MTNYLESVTKQFKYYKSLGDKTFDQLTERELLWRMSPDANSISIIVKHMVGNMLSRWTNFLTEDGEKEWRQRDLEFEEAYQTREELIKAWEIGWNCLFNALEKLTVKDLDKTIYIRNQGQSVMDAINRQLAHYSYHIGQIVYLGTLIKGAEWKSLSIPKGGSDSFNKKLMGN